MDTLSPIEKLIDKNVLLTLQVFIEEDQKEFYLLEISRLSKVPPASAFRIVNNLVKLGILELVQIRKFKLYRLSKSKETEKLKSILKREAKTLDIFVQRIQELNGVSQVILHGEHAKDKADILIIGENIDPSFVKGLTVEIKEAYGFTISSLSLTQDQYAQMSNMGLYSGEKKTLFTRK